MESKKDFYFINECVEWLLTNYNWTGCTDVELRDLVMGNTNNIIQQIILKHNLHHIYRGRDESSFNDLVHVAYMQIERTLYKYKAAPHCRNCFTYERPQVSCLYIPGQYDHHIMKPEEVVDFCPSCPNCGMKLYPYPIIEPKQGLYGGTWTILYRGTSKVFNLWSQVARTVILAHVKKDSRDKRNNPSYKNHFESSRHRISGEVFSEMMKHAENMLWYDLKALSVLSVLKDMSFELNNLSSVIVKKNIIQSTGLTKKEVEKYILLLKLVFKDYKNAIRDSDRDKVSTEYCGDFNFD